MFFNSSSVLVCSSRFPLPHKFRQLTVFIVLAGCVFTVPVNAATPVCESADSDPDGDGWGWEDNASCTVEGSVAANNSNNVSTVTYCRFLSSDDDGDGWGWDGSGSCRVSAGTNTGANQGTNNATCVDDDGDGWGWNGSNSCVTSPAAVSGPAAITDLVLLTGQSNALGAGTSFNPALDGGHHQVYAFTNSGWRVADLHQVWDLGWHPRTEPGTSPDNNLALHFGKRMVERDSSRVVGFIVATAPGQPISHWAYNGEFYNSIRSKVGNAINQLPHKSKLDGILFHQGESDGGDTITYGNALRGLINNFRTEAWFDYNEPFICGETSRLPVNNQLNSLNRDSDPLTSCVPATDLPTHLDQQHFTAEGLRTLGARYADRYLQIVQ